MVRTSNDLTCMGGQDIAFTSPPPNPSVYSYSYSYLVMLIVRWLTGSIFWSGSSKSQRLFWLVSPVMLPSDCGHFSLSTFSNRALDVSFRDASENHNERMDRQ